MGSPRTVRVALILVCLGLLLAMSVWSGAGVTGSDSFPAESEVIEKPDRYLGERVILTGTVSDTDPVVMTVTDVDGTVGRFTVTGLSQSVGRGNELRVYGVLSDRDTIRALGAVVVTRRGLWYAWIISFLAGIWVLVRVIEHWRFDRAEWVFRPHTTPSGVDDQKQSSGDSDA